MRMFVSIDLPENIKIKCMDIIEKLNSSGTDIKAVKKENLHITLKFLGEVREDDAENVKKILTEYSANQTSFRLGFSGLGYFGKPLPRIIWLGFSAGKERIYQMASDLNEKLDFIRKEERSPKPHLTLARVKSSRNSGGLIEIIRGLTSVKIGEVEVNQIKLMGSILTDSGPKYSDLGLYELGKE
jgi:2'-5' RNA ligase